MNKVFFLELSSAENSSGGIMNIIFLVAIFIIFYFFMVRPQNKKRKELQNLRDNLKKGDNVVTIGGIHGKVVEVKETTVLVTVDASTKLKIDKSSISLDSSTKLNEENKQ
ncbi:preprotein translocase subunit YajC [Flavobacteriales bacterium]|jgi:preprotein translocase subunit YajC|nr:preprotein translocase subunit YajC [Flavobacteriales bacterium]